MLVGTVRITVVLSILLSLCGSLCSEHFTINHKIVGGKEYWHNGYFLLKWTVFDGTHYIGNLARCGCTLFDQTIPECVQFMYLASFVFHQIDDVNTHFGLVWLIFTQTVLDGEYIMA